MALVRPQFSPWRVGALTSPPFQERVVPGNLKPSVRLKIVTQPFVSSKLMWLIPQLAAVVSMKSFNLSAVLMLLCTRRGAPCRVDSMASATRTG